MFNISSHFMPDGTTPFVESIYLISQVLCGLYKKYNKCSQILSAICVMGLHFRLPPLKIKPGILKNIALVHYINWRYTMRLEENIFLLIRPLTAILQLASSSIWIFVLTQLISLSETRDMFILKFLVFRVLL